MLMVETELRQSSIHGTGVFLVEPVRKGDLIWRFDSRIDRVYSEGDVASLPERMQRFLRTYSTWHEASRLWILCGDNARHFNHSDMPNTLSLGTGFGDDVAARDLPAGTELTTNYALICDNVRVNGASYLSASPCPSPSSEKSPSPATAS
ncbi:MAG TPA: SET domain-containing protein [Allosphingosinicella sp.]